MTPSQQTLDTLYRRYHRQIRAYLSRMTGDAQEAEDLTQEVFVKACRQLAGEARGGNMKAWLFQVATYTCFDHHRRSTRRVREAPIPDDLQLTSTGDPFEQAQSTAAVVASLRRLAERHRAVLILKDVNGFRHAEIAAAMGISEGAAQILLHRARAEFKTAYTEIVAGRTTSCPVADRVAQDLVGTTLTPAQRRELKKHARTCPECRARLSGRKVPTGALGFLLAQPQAPDVGLPFIPPVLPLPPAPPAFDITMALHGLLPQVMQTLSSKAAAVMVAAALVVGGQLATESAVPRGAVNDRTAATTMVTQPLTIEAGAPAGEGHDGVPHDTLWEAAPEAVRGQTLTDAWRVRQAQDNLGPKTPPTTSAARVQEMAFAGPTASRPAPDESSATAETPGPTESAPSPMAPNPGYADAGPPPAAKQSTGAGIGTPALKGDPSSPQTEAVRTETGSEAGRAAGGSRPLDGNRTPDPVLAPSTPGIDASSAAPRGPATTAGHPAGE